MAYGEMQEQKVIILLLPTKHCFQSNLVKTIHYVAHYLVHQNHQFSGDISSVSSEEYGVRSTARLRAEHVIKLFIIDFPGISDIFPFVHKNIDCVVSALVCKSF